MFLHAFEPRYINHLKEDMENQIEQAERVSRQYELPLRPKEVRLRMLEDADSRPLFHLIPHYLGNVPMYLYIPL